MRWRQNAPKREKNFNFRLPSVAQKRLCLSSLISLLLRSLFRARTETRDWREWNNEERGPTRPAPPFLYFFLFQLTLVDYVIIWLTKDSIRSPHISKRLIWEIYAFSGVWYTSHTLVVSQKEGTGFVDLFKGSMSTPGACARSWEALWNHRRVQEAVFICLNRVHLWKVSWIFYLQTFFSNYRSSLSRYFWKLLQRRKTKNPTMSCIQISLNRTLLRVCSSWQSRFKFRYFLKTFSMICSSVLLYLAVKPEYHLTLNFLCMLQVSHDVSKHLHILRRGAPCHPHICTPVLKHQPCGLLENCIMPLFAHETFSRALLSPALLLSSQYQKLVGALIWNIYSKWSNFWNVTWSNIILYSSSLR